MYAQGIGVVSDGETMVVLGFKTQREIITEIGYLSSDAENVLLHACFNALCERMTQILRRQTALPRHSAT